MTETAKKSHLTGNEKHQVRKAFRSARRYNGEQINHLLLNISPKSKGDVKAYHAAISTTLMPFVHKITVWTGLYSNVENMYTIGLPLKRSKRN